MKQFRVNWFWRDTNKDAKQTMHMCNTSAEALQKSRNQMFAMRYNVGQMFATVTTLGEAPAKAPAKKPVAISTEVDRQHDFWWNQL